MRRRQFITLLGCSLIAAPFVARAQLADRIYRIGMLLPLPAEILAGFFDELRRLGFVEGRNLKVDRGGASAPYDQFSAIAAGLVAAGVDAILCAGDAAARAAQAATRTIPILAVADDMIGSGLVPSLSHPGGNMTGISILAANLDGKRQDLLIDLLPAMRHMAALSDVRTTTPVQLERVQEVARSRGVELSIQSVERREEIVPAIDAAKAAGAAALNVLASPFLHENAQTIVMRTAELRMPAMYQWPDIAEQGGFAGYGPRFTEIFRQWARQLAKVLVGVAPADLPVEQPTRFELVINLRAARGLGIDVPPTLLVRADAVVE
jgi:putative tryptophan/tyrosine transport system substrate-binding protein